MAKKPNIIFIMTDQQRADSFGPNRHANADYPAMEALAKESVSFTNFFTAAMPCVPSRRCFLTGRQPWSMGCDGNAKLSMGDEQTWMSELRRYGYHCVSVGKTHMVHAGSFHVQIPMGKTFGNQKGWDAFHPAASPEPDETFFDIAATTRCFAVMEKLKKQGPFALFLGIHAPHAPLVMPEKYLDFCKPEYVTLPDSGIGDAPVGKSKGYYDRLKLFEKKFGDVTDDMFKKGIAGYHCMLKMVDDCLERLMRYLKESKLLENTIVVFCSDHGDLCGEHRLFGKGATFHEGETRIPMLIRFPDGSHKGKQLDRLASSIDFVPTLLDYLGVATDMPLPGHSLMPMINENKEVRDLVTCATRRGMMVRTKKHKLWESSINGGEMYDLEKDPTEVNNLYDDEDSKDLRQEMTRKLLHARIEDDYVNNLPTEQELTIHREIRASGEPEF